MEPFKHFLEAGLVERRSKDPARARSMLDRALKRFDYVKGQEIDQNSASFIFEGIYEVMRECAHSLMLADGYHPGPSHEIYAAFLADSAKIETWRSWPRGVRGACPGRLSWLP